MFNNHQKNGCRKRTRDEEDEDCDECMPISKRINRLCIRQSSDGWSEEQHNQEASRPGTSFTENANIRSTLQREQQQQQQQPRPLLNYAPALVNPPTNSVSSPLPQEQHVNSTPLGMPAASVRVPSADSGIDVSVGDYEPELGAHDNPIYFHINGRLFEANRHRMHRQQQHGDIIEADFLSDGPQYPHQ